MEREIRESGIDPVGCMPWGTHLCQFYETAQDLASILVPYFQAGLEGNERCMWVTSEPLGVAEATEALRRAGSPFDVEEALRTGQIEILPYEEWYTRGGTFDMRRVLDGWAERHDRARADGFDGLRVTGNTCWLQAADWASFAAYEQAIDEGIGRYRMLALCTYRMSLCGAAEVIDVINNHRFALVQRGGRWQMVESSQRKRAAEALRQSEARYQLLFENMSSAVADHRMVYQGDRPVDYVFLEANAAFERLTGLARDSIIGRRVTEVVPGIERDPFDWIGTYGRVARTGEPIRFEQRSEPLGRYHSVSAWSPAPGTFATAFEDITDRKLAEEERERLLETVRRQSAELRDVLRSVSHDLASPLTAIQLQAQLLERRLDRPGLEVERAAAEKLVGSSLRLAQMVEDLREAARIESGQLAIDRRRIDPAEFLREWRDRAASDPRVGLELSPGLPVVEADPMRLERVLANLLSNALKYSDPGAPVLVKAERQDGELVVSVLDHGPGISAEELPHVFDRFWRSRSAQRSKQGLGLGLYIARESMRAQGGRLWAESSPGKGSAFSLALPASPCR